MEEHLLAMTWKVNYADITFTSTEGGIGVTFYPCRQLCYVAISYFVHSLHEIWSINMRHNYCVSCIVHVMGHKHITVYYKTYVHVLISVPMFTYGYIHTSCARGNLFINACEQIDRHNQLLYLTKVSSLVRG